MKESLGNVIVFEGLDCSFKETNAKALANFLSDQGYRTKVYSFPSYGKESAKEVEEYLKLPSKVRNEMTCLEKSIPYLNDIAHVVNHEVSRDIKMFNYIIFDRFWFSNIYYNARNKDDIDHITRYMMKHSYPFIRPNIIFKMIPKFELIQENLKRKKNKDNIEKDIKFLKKVYTRYISFVNEEVLGYPVEPIFVDDDEGVRSREDILSDIISVCENRHVFKRRNEHADSETLST